MAARIGLETEVWTLTDLAASLRRERSGLSQAAGYMVSAETQDKRKACYHQEGYLKYP